MEQQTREHRGARRRRTIGLGMAVGAVALVAGAAVVASLVLQPDAGRQATADPSSTPTPSSAPGPAPDATPVDGSEVLPPEASTDRRTAGVPLLTPAPPLVTGPLPEDASADGALVKGYPADLAGPATGDTVLQSSVSSEGRTMQAALTARTDAEPDAVREHFRALWDELGLTPDAPAGDDQLTYRGPSATVTLAVETGGTGTVYSVFTVVTAG